ncbi:putative peptidoglycan glycosyltransferase FtsW [Lachnospiraceae bacterium]|nr:putative peptidoglycan glycosyltransferase FtsW [Acetatifactor sp.]GFH95705.1 putative peptidoglycan glycosyltransferase FtsW [Lachnospiraceae bacterium]
MAERSRDRKKRKKEQTEYFFDYSLLFVVLFLMGFGLVMIYSASSYEAQQDFGSGTYYLRKQLVADILGLVVMMVMANIPYRFWQRFTTLAYFASLALIPVVLTPLGVESHGARRWVGIPGIGFNIQPAEVAKTCMILFLANMVCLMGKKLRTAKGLAVLIALSVPHSLAVWKITDNMSSAIIILGIAMLMIFVATPDYKRFVIMGAAAAAVVIGIVWAIFNTTIIEKLDFRGERILAWRDPEAFAQGKGFQTLQALYAIGSGGIWGKGLGQSMQKLDFIPEAQNDMIFSIICEELGLFGAIAIILMFIMLLWRMMIVANNAPDLFGALLVVGVMGHIAIQVILNIAVVTNTIPNTGISLPFISYGGSSVLFLMAEIGLVLSVAKRIQLRELV